MRFEWDARKDELERKHGVSFEDAILVFSDQYAVSEVDDRYADYRRFAIGRSGRRILFVAHQYEERRAKGEIVRIISAREASSRERRLYADRP